MRRLSFKTRQGISSSRIVPTQFSFLHICFWAVVTAIFLYDRRYLIVKAGLPNFIICSIMRISLLIAISYTNLYVLIPRYLVAKKYTNYAIAVISLIIGYVIIQGLYDYYLFKAILAPVKHEPEVDFIIYNLVSTLFYLILTVTLKFSIDWYQQNQVLQKTKMEKLQAEVKYLQAQVNPHFLFNILNNLYSLTLKKSDAAPGMVLKLSEMMEYILYDANENFVQLDREIKYLYNYIELEKLRQGNKADIKFEVKGNPNGYKVAPFLFLPMIENAFKHGVSKIINNPYLHACITIETNKVSFNMENNKLNFLDSRENGGIGLTNLKQRLQLHYPGKHVFEIKDDINKYRTTLQIQLD